VLTEATATRLPVRVKVFETSSPHNHRAEKIQKTLLGAASDRINERRSGLTTKRTRLVWVSQQTDTGPNMAPPGKKVGGVKRFSVMVLGAFYHKESTADREEGVFEKKCFSHFLV